MNDSFMSSGEVNGSFMTGRPRAPAKSRWCSPQRCTSVLNDSFRTSEDLNDSFKTSGERVTDGRAARPRDFAGTPAVMS
ncbi:hypothetical protein H4696_004287 [Amycolatopsis lexingtonensis]|uniref:Uncharacterized protein n=1 Tax=Amycolatopsis lexingtonensis TaxID=218822 RepID=A0ABR9I1V0_9PSEU|nr:hypothetical protein [Amycolatopsis lexingtonensis]